MSDIETPAPPRPPSVVSGVRALVLCNEKAGSVAPGDGEKLRALLAAHGFSDIEMADCQALDSSAFKTAQSHDVIVVLGGDGTARSAAEAAPDNSPPMILLPGGTLNVLPRALYGDLAWPEALAAALERGRVRRLVGGFANGAPFFVAAMFGAPTLLARAREAVREGKYISAIKRFRHFGKRAFARGLRARPERMKMRKAEAIGVLCPSYSGAVEGEHLEWVRLDTARLVDFVRVGLRALGPGWRDDPAVELRRCRQGDIVSLGVIPAVLDGEPRTFVSRVKITYNARGPRVLALDPEEA